MLNDVVAASWSGEGIGLDTLAHPITDRIPDEAFVRSPALLPDLNALLLRCRARDSLIPGLGVSAVTRYRPGVRALFVGPSGAGKTMAAAWLATRLGLPLYRVDLAAVISKYIGETEKNLAQLLARAESAEVILLFDEADALFGKRSEVNDSHDRYANIEISYLPQKMDQFEGIAVLASNLMQNLDEAFIRRLTSTIYLPFPDEDSRRRTWERIWPPEVPLAAETDFDQSARGSN